MQQPQIIVQQPVAPTGDEEYQCGTKNCWIAFTCGCFVLAIILIAVPIAKGGCSSHCSGANLCQRPPFTTGPKCEQFANGCTKGGSSSSIAPACYASTNCNLGKCMTQTTANGYCADPACNYNDSALDVGAAWGMVLSGIALLIATCVGCCGIVPCCCFKKDIVFPAQNAPVVPIMPTTTTVALGVNGAPPPPPPSDPGKSA